MRKDLLTYSIILYCLLMLAVPSHAQEVASSQDSVSERYVRIDNIFILGNKRTRESIIRRELSIKRGMLIHYPDLVKQMELDQNKIFNTRLFNSVKVTSLDLDATKVDIVVQVDERWYTFPIPVVKFADRNFNDWLKNQGGDFSRINYGIKFTQYNMRGRNEKLKFNAQFGFTKRFDLSYSIPYIDRSQKNGLHITAGYKEQKNTAYATVDHKQAFRDAESIQFEEVYATAKYTRRSRFYDFHSVILEFNHGKISDSVNLLNPHFFSNQSTNQRYFALRYYYTKDKRDIAAYPLHGYRVQAELSKIGIGLFNELDVLDFRLTHDRYFDLGKKFYAAIYTKGVISTPDNQSYRLFPSLGRHVDFVRGYELYLIEGSRYALHKTTFKRLLFKGDVPLNFLKARQFEKLPYAFYLKTYFDAGYVKSFNEYEQNNRLSNKMLFGTGVGLDFVTWYDFVIRTEYSMNHLKETGFFFHFKKGF